ncbi:unnamed protein product [Mytilus edulis]|uniref:Uncharacterized protein n=1 Tax=Mytilus edulis TaxID=6550 RepID=A0A8S3QEI4_MYTED|nr:unnamed protein product [Mytilus edulis]
MDYIWIKLIAVCVCSLVVSVDLSAAAVCKGCWVLGQFKEGNTEFEYKNGNCLEMTGCYCSCDGKFFCRKERNICDRTVESGRDFYSSSRRTSYQSSSSSRSGFESGQGSGAVIENVRNSACDRKCIVDGAEIDGGTYFSHKNQCISYSSCYCGCDGKWQCPASNAKNTCTGAGGGQLVESDEQGCRSCVIDGARYTGNSDFTYRNNCIEWTDCRCRCDGSWRCASNSGKWVCDNVCNECEVDGRKIQGKSQFRHQTECIIYDPCVCNCDGSWDCPAKNGKWICTDQCLNCEINGREYKGRSEFRLREDCWEWNPCTCNCDGSWNCPRDNAKWVCTDKCLDCDVKGQKYPGNTQFQYVDGCYEYNCNCQCDGGWSCPANRTRDMCRLNMQTGCYFCTVNGNRFEGSTSFTYEENCIRYEHCACNCDGSWECPGEKAINTCRRNDTTGCDFCDVYGQQEQGNSRFEIQQDCWRFDCECDCNGNWRCSETGARYICGSQLLETSGCKACLAGGTRYASQSSFKITWGCVTYECSCNCDGSWICPSRLAINSCSNSHFQKFLISSVTNLPNSWCSECTIGGSVYPGFSQFEYQEKCTRQYARCYCNGGYRFDSSIITGCSGNAELSISKGNCIDCKFNNAVFAANSEFEISSQCKRYRCKCECNGRPQCQSVVENVCGSVITVVESDYLTGSVTRTQGGTVVVEGGGQTGTIVSGGGGGGSRTVVVSGGRESGQTGSASVVLGGGRETTRTVVVSGGGGNAGLTGGGSTSSGSRTVVVRGGGGGGGGGTREVTSETRVVVTGGGGGSSSSRTVVSGGGSTSVIGPDGSICYHCVGLDGKKYPGNSDFTFRRGCAVWKCQCNCFGRAICRPHDLSACLVEPQCRDCVVEGRTYRSNRMFSYEKDCISHQCRCMCDGSPRCVQTVAFNCERDKPRCTQCVIGGQQYQPNTLFDLVTRCRKQRCQCDCDGTYRCSEAQNTCSNEDRSQLDTCAPCEVDGQSHQAGTAFTIDRGCYRMSCSCSCRDRLKCDQSKTVDICENDRGERCKACVLDGERYAPNSKFERESGCLRQRCHCHCNGKFDCLSTGVNICKTDNTRTTSTQTDTSRTTSTQTDTSRTRPTQTDTSRTRPTQTGTGSGSVTSTETEKKDCKPCIADRIERQIGVTFCLDRGCKRYQCKCYCTGRYACQTDKPENICDSAGKVTATPCAAAAVSQEITSGGSRTTTDTRQTAGGGSRTTTTTTRVTETSTTETKDLSQTTVFDYEERNGGVAVSDADRRGRCMQCNIAEQFYEGNSEFHLELGCKRFRCLCNCDASWECPRQRPENICKKETCRNCRLRDKEYPPNSSFRIDIDRCRKYECTCPCSGVYSCPPENIVNTCEQQCKECVVKGNRYQANAPFTYEEGCNRFSCDCKCDGSWNCPASKTVNTCRSTCKECELKGQKYRGNSRFTYEEGSFRYNCDCKCDGSWNCPASRTERIGSTPQPQTGQCTECEVKGRKYRGNSRFSYEEGNFRYNCDCNCDGSWNCPASRTERLSGSQQTGQCTECEVKGRKYRGNSRFSYDEGSFRYNCDCKCDGSWNCPASRTERIGSTPRPQTGQCTECEVKGRKYRGNSRFSYDEGEFRFNCDCNCDGSWNCPASRTEIINSTPRPQTRPQSGQCTECEVKGRKYRGNSRFSYDEGEFRFNCDCNCDGSWNCPASRTERINANPQPAQCTECEVNGRKYRGNSRFSYDEGIYRFNCDCKCDGSFNCPASRTERINANPQPAQCTECVVKGRRYRGNARFSYDEGNFRYNCDCNCDGSYNCPASRTERINSNSQTGQCTECEVKGRKYRGNSRFSYDEGNFRYNCECNCDGSWNCPASRTERLSGSQQTSGSRTSLIGTGSERVAGTGSRRVIESGSSRQTGSGSSQITDAGSRSSSETGRSSSESRRTGSGSIVDSKSITETRTSTGTEKVSSTSTLGESQTITELRSRSGYTSGSAVDSRGCRACIVNKVEYNSNSAFQFEDNCFRFSCRCKCDGSWSCPAERTVNICPQSCRECRVDGKAYPANTIFEYESSCFRFNCDCACDGSYNCPAERTKDICSGRPDKCRNCAVEGRDYPPNRKFQYDKGCNRFDCDCNCDGSWRCPAERTINICGGLGSQTCRECSVKGKRYPPNKTFSYIDGCNLNKCSCSCDGVHSCPSVTDICKSNGQICRDCLVKGNRYLPNKPFTYTERCDRFNCDCNCDGSWNCPAERTENLCTSGQCQKCRARGNEYAGNSVFVIEDNCRQFQCRCHCDGHWDCSKESARVC